MKIEEIRKLSDGDLRKELIDLHAEQFKLRMQRGSGQLTKFAQLKTVRRNIARVKTLLTERQAKGGNE